MAEASAVSVGDSGQAIGQDSRSLDTDHSASGENAGTIALNDKWQTNETKAVSGKRQMVDAVVISPNDKQQVDNSGAIAQSDNQQVDNSGAIAQSDNQQVDNSGTISPNVTQQSDNSVTIALSDKRQVDDAGTITLSDNRQAASLRVFLADTASQPGWHMVRMKPSGVLYVRADSPVIERSDLLAIQAATDQKGDGILVLILSDEGLHKLRSITAANPGKRLALIVEHTMLAAPAYAGPVHEQQLAFPVGTARNAEIAARAVAGVGAPEGR